MPPFDVINALVIGFGLGVRHATDPDHIALVFDLLRKDADTSRAARVAAVWGLGHTLSFLLVGLALVVGDVRLPEAFDVVVELGIGVMLVAFGAWYLCRAHAQVLEPPRGTSMRTFAVGLAHGLAGSSGAALLVTTTLPSRTLGAWYLGLFAAGTAVGMAVLTLLMSRALSSVSRHSCAVRCRVVQVAGSVSLCVGVVLIVSALFHG